MSQKTKLTITIRLDKEDFDEAKRQNAGDIKELIEEAIQDVFNTQVKAIKWTAEHEDSEQ